jgi:hypothetical protein
MPCQFCRGELDLAQQFRYLVEAQTVDDPVMMAAIRRLPHAHGRPLRCCRGCQTAIERKAIVGRFVPARARATGLHGRQYLVLTALAVGVGVLTARVVG